MTAKNKIKTTLLRLLETYPADELTVKMICNEAQVSKQSLYNNYYGILAAVEDVIEDLINDAARDCRNTEKWFAGIHSVLQMFAERRNIINHLYNSKYKQDMLNAVSRCISPIIEAGILDQAHTYGVDIDDNDKAVISGLYTDVFIGLITRYLNNRMSQDPAYLVYIYRTILANSTAEAMAKIKQSVK